MKRHLIVILFLLTMTSVVRSEDRVLYDRAGDPHPFTVFMRESGWCWYQGPRAIIHDGKLLIGGVEGNGSGDVKVGVYDLEANQPLGSVVLHKNYDHDDHNAPVFFARPDGSILAMYARHHRDKFHQYRISTPGNPMQWGEEKEKAYEPKGPRDKVTYMNFHYLAKEGKLYNFFRMQNFCPTLATSQDAGKTWSEATQFIAAAEGYRRRPYARYADNGIDTVHVSFTDGHPYVIGNSVYYTALRDGNFYKADGTKIKNLAKDGPLRPHEAELIYKGSGILKVPKDPKRSNRPNCAWTSSTSFDKDGHPHIGYMVFVTNEDQRFRIASWDGQKWTDREVAFAGKGFVGVESGYNGLITLDPEDPEVVVIATEVDPTTGEDRGGQHEVYRAKVGPEDDIKTIKWQAITKNSPVKNIRPVILREDGKRCILWSRGVFHGYTDYQFDTVGIVEDVK